MKNIKKSIKLATVVAALGMGVSSCSLDLLPLNEVVLENFWTEKSDVESVVASCYSTFYTTTYLHTIMAWGEGRSDNTVMGKDCPEALKSLMKGSIKTTNSYCDWKDMYILINRCNTVLEYAPDVAKRDPNYTDSDLRINIAECKALRAMSYLYLIKTFRDVPLVTEPTIDDDLDKMYKTQSDFGTVLDWIISDLEGCVSDAPIKYHDYKKTVGRITQPAIYAMLSEMYLWRASDVNRSVAQQKADYNQSYDYAQKVIDAKKQIFRENSIDGVNLNNLIDRNVYTKYGYPLLGEIVTGYTDVPAAYNQIFCDGYSFESIFEFGSWYGSTTTWNTGFSYLFGAEDEKTSQTKTYMLADGDLMRDIPTGTTFNLSIFPTATDIRSISSFSWEDATSFSVNKYCSKSVSTGYDGKSVINFKTSGIVPRHSIPSAKNSYHNYVFYRLTEMILFQAEAEIEFAKLLEKENAAASEASENGNSAADSVKVDAAKTGLYAMSADQLKADALQHICAVYLRSNPYANSAKDALPNASKLTSIDDYELCLMRERQREFLFEGKRYYDLVRQARREGNTNKFITYMMHKFAEGGASVAVKLKKIDFMYLPVLKKQIQINPMLKQNSAYQDEETIENN